MFVCSFPCAFALGFVLGANGISTSMGSVCGAKLMGINQILVMGSIFEIIGALTMGGEVAHTLSKGIIDVNQYVDVPN